ncbi:hypothetical protein V8F33_002751 [Rhypophila sp. PSN 637]
MYSLLRLLYILISDHALWCCSYGFVVLRVVGRKLLVVPRWKVRFGGCRGVDRQMCQFMGLCLGSVRPAPSSWRGLSRTSVRGEKQLRITGRLLTEAAKPRRIVLSLSYIWMGVLKSVTLITILADVAACTTPRKEETGTNV